jgi:hypothetical protein
LIRPPLQIDIELQRTHDDGSSSGKSPPRLRGAPAPTTTVQLGASLAGKLSTEAVSHPSLMDAVPIGSAGTAGRGLNLSDDLSVTLETPWQEI